MAFEVKGKSAIVTGAGSGINFCFAKLLLQKGCNVVLADVTLRPEARALVSEFASSSPSAVFHRTDVTRWADLDDLFAAAAHRFGDVDIVCPGAGVYDPPWSNFWHPPGTSSSRDAPDGDRYATLDVNVTHPIRATQLALAAFVGAQRRTGRRAPKRVLIVSSIAGQNANLHTPIYVAAKHAMNGFVRSLGALEERFGIRVNGVAPGVIRTPLWTEHPEKLQFISEGADEWATPEEVAEAMLRCLVDEGLPGGEILEVGKGQTRVVKALNDPGPSGPGHTVSNLVGKYEEVYALLEAGDWGKSKL